MELVPMMINRRSVKHRLVVTTTNKRVSIVVDPLGMLRMDLPLEIEIEEALEIRTVGVTNQIGSLLFLILLVLSGTIYYRYRVLSRVFISK